MKKHVGLILGGVAILIMGFCIPEKSSNDSEEIASEENKEFDAYWFTGTAEVSSYTLNQARYGNMNPGKSILVFVTEDFLIDKQVKKESMTSERSTSVLKLNKIDRFTTGIYDYSLMLSTFTPVSRYDYPFALKTTFSAQDWCGQSFMQVNRRGDGYQAMLRSYFESEGDKNVILDDSFLEDEIWTLARLDPMALPQGDFSIIPSNQQLRLRHEPVTSELAKGKMVLEVRADKTEEYVYTVDFSSGRQFKLHIQSVFPFRIYGWEEKVKSGFGQNAQWLTTTATLDKTIKSSYWGENSPKFMEERKRLGLD